MEEKDYENLSKKVSTIEHVVTAYVCSRAGVYTAGNAPKMADRNMYSAITSLAFGTAEQVGHEMNDDLQHISLNFSQKRLLIIGLGPRHLMGLLVDKQADQDQILAKVRSFITE
jgi:predicted regulator of Ras-like GTPase activity (Roadblock/LC7/MglB family)